MKDRKARIITGGQFVSSLGVQNRWDTKIFKTAAQRLIELLQAELNGDTEEDLVAVQEAINAEFA